MTLRRCLLSSLAATVLLAGASGLDSKGLEPLALDPANFDQPQGNPFHPLMPGMTWVYEAETDEGVEVNEVTVTHDTVEILGVTCTVVHDVERLAVEGVGLILLEETDDWFAPDDRGNVWYFGEDTVEHLYDDGWNPIGTSSAGSWTAGVDGAEPGIIMLADPVPGISYRQEFYEGVAEDMAKVLRLDARVSVAYGSFDGCLKTKEWSPLSPGAVEHKYYAPGIGLVLVEELTGGRTVHVELVSVSGP